MSESERMKAFEEACEELWPAIRFFGLCGAHPPYMIAAEKIAKLLGKLDSNNASLESVEAAAHERAKRETIDGIATFLGTSSDVRKLMGVGLQNKLREMVEQLG